MSPAPTVARARARAPDRDTPADIPWSHDAQAAPEYSLRAGLRSCWLILAEAATYDADKLWLLLKPIPIELSDDDGPEIQEVGGSS